MPIQLKRSSNTAVPPELADGEPAFSAVGNVLFIGVNGGVLPIAGARSPGVLTANQAIVTDSSNFIDNINVSNTIFLGNTNSTSLRLTIPNGESRIASNGSLDIFANNYIKLHSNPNSAVLSGTTPDSNWVIVDDEGIYIQSFDSAGTTVADITVEAGGINILGNVAPFISNTHSLGSTSSTWRNIHAGNLVSVGVTSLNTTGFAVGGSITGNTSRLALGTSVGIQANGSIGVSGQVLTSNGTSVYWNTPTTGTVTQVNTGIGLAGGPITTSGTISILANSGIVANTTGVYVNTAFIGTLTSNNSTNFDGLSLATVQGQITGNAATAFTNAVNYVTSQSFVNTAQLSANVSTLQGQITSNAATAYTNAVAYVDSRPFVNTAQLSANVSTLQGQITANSATAYTNAVAYVDSRPFVNTAQLSANVTTLQGQITGNAATAYTNAVAYVTAQSFVNTSQLSANVSTLQSQITSNAATAYTNAVAYVDSRPFVNTSQLASNLALYAQLSGAVFTGTVTTNNLTVTGNLTLQGNTVIVGANNLVVNDAVISLHSPANGSPLTSDDGRNIGISFHYYDTEDRHGALLRDNSTGRLTWYIDSTDPNTGNNVVGTILGTIQANTFYAGNATVFATINATSYTGTSNNSTNFNGQSLATIQGQITGNAATAYTNAVAYVDSRPFVNTAQLSANVATLQSQITANAATAYSNAVAYVDSRPFVNTAQLSANVATLQSQITGNAATAYTNAVAYVDSRPFVNTAQLSANVSALQSQITGNAATAYTNAVAYVDSRPFVNTAQLSANVSTLQGEITSNAATAYTNAVAYVDGKSFVNTAQLSANVSTLQGQITSNAATAYTNAVAYVDGKSFVNTSQLSANLTNYQTTAGLASNVATLTSNNSTNFDGLSLATIQGQITGNAATAYTNAVAYVDGKNFVNTAQLSGNLTLYATIANPTFTGNVTTGNVIINTTGGIRANGSFGSVGQVLTSNGTTVYWDTASGGFTNGQSISVNNFVLTGAFTANSSNGSAGQILISNGVGAYWGPAPTGGGGTVTQVTTGSGLTGGPITTTGTVSVLANTGLIANSTGVFVNSAYIATIDANNATNFGGLSLTTVQSQITGNAATAYTNAVAYVDGKSFVNTAQLSANVTTLQGQITGNAATAYTNSVNYVTAQSFVNTSQLSANLSNYQTTAGLASNVATLTANNSNNFGGLSLVAVQGQITGNAATAFSNATAFASNATNLSSGTVNNARLPSAINVTSVNAATFSVGSSVISNTTGTFVNGSINLTRNDTRLTFTPVAGGANVYFVQQSDDNFVLYTTNTSGGAKAVFNVYANTNAPNQNSAFRFNVPVDIGTQGVYANNRLGTAGEVLISNGSSAYWGAAGGGGTVTQVSSGAGLVGGPITTSGTLSVLANNGIVSNSTGVFVNANSGLISNSSGVFVNANTGIVSNSTGVFVNTAFIGTLSVNNSTNFNGQSLATIQGQITGNAATAYTNAVAYVDSRPFVNTSQLSSNLALYAQLSGAVFTGAVTTNNLTVTGNLTLQGNTVIVGANNLVVNDAVISLHSPANGAALTSNDGRNIGISFHYFDTEDRHGALLRDNDTGRLVWYFDSTDPNTGNNVVGTILGTIQANTFHVGNSTVFATVNATSYTGTSNNATNFGTLSLATVQGQITGNAATAYTNAVAYVDSRPFVNTAQLSGNLALYATLANPTFTGNVTTGNVIVNTTGGIRANGSFGTSGQVLASNGTTVFWATPTTGTVTQVNTGAGLSGGPFTTTGTVSVLANSGIVANSTGVFVNANSGIVANVTGVFVNANSGIIANAAGVFVNANSGIVANVTGVFVNTAFIGTLTANNSTNFNSQPASFYANATNLTSGTLDNARLPSAINVTTANAATLSVGSIVVANTTGITTSANISITSTGELLIAAGAGIQANGSFGTAGQALYSNGTSVYWDTVAAGVNTAAQFVWTNTHIFNANVTVNSFFTVANSSATVAIFASNGNVGIGTAAPTSRLQVNGAFAATTKSFLIDHPTKSGMTLRYGSLEGPENGVYVRGRLTGSNVIELPDYWTALVDPETITVNLTPVGRHQGLYVKDVVDNKVYIGCSFHIRALDFYFTVYGERKDVPRLVVEQ